MSLKVNLQLFNHGLTIFIPVKKALLSVHCSVCCALCSKSDEKVKTDRKPVSNPRTTLSLKLGDIYNWVKSQKSELQV